MKKFENKKLILFLLLVILLILEITFDRNLFNAILKNNNISIALITLIAGLFGFIIATIPLIIQILEKKDSYLVQKLNEKENFKIFVKPLFERNIKLLKQMLRLFCFILVLFVLDDINKQFLTQISLFDLLFYKFVFKLSVIKIIKFILTTLYVILVYDFINYLRLFIQDIKSIINLYTNKE